MTPAWGRAAGESGGVGEQREGSGKGKMSWAVVKMRDEGREERDKGGKTVVESKRSLKNRGEINYSAEIIYHNNMIIIHLTSICLKQVFSYLGFMYFFYKLCVASDVNRTLNNNISSDLEETNKKIHF